MRKIERHCAGLELRADGRRLVGPAIRYGEVSESHRERFEAGAFNLGDGATRYLNVGHDSDIVIAHTGAGLEFRDSRRALEVRATLPDIPAANRALDAVKAGELRGFSIEFHAEAERRESGIRVVERADLVGVGLVREPSYAGSVAEVRGAWKKAAMSPGARKRDWARSTIPTGKTCDCECAGPVDQIRIMENAFNEMIRRAIEGAADDIAQAVIGNTGPHNNLGTTATGAVRLSKAAGGMRVTLSEAAKETPAGRSLRQADATAPAVARPLIDHDHELTSYRDVGGVRIYESAFAPVILFKSAPGRKGWNGVEFFEETKTAQRRRRKARIRRWL